MAAKAKKPPAKKLTSPSDLFDNMLSGDKNVKPAAKPPSKEKVTKPKVSTDQCSGSRAPVPFWPRDPGWVKNQDLDTESYFRELRNNFLGKKLKFLDAAAYPDPGSGNLFTRDPGWKNSDPGCLSRIRNTGVPGPQDPVPDLFAFLSCFVLVGAGTFWAGRIRTPRSVSTIFNMMNS
jgi:hypothetical protein